MKNLNQIYQKALFTLINRYPFFGYFLQDCKLSWVKEGKGVPTAQVEIDNSLNLKLVINEKFFRELPEQERVGILMHEVLHLVHDHLKQFKRKVERKDMEMANWAADIEINQFIPQKMLPEWALTINSIKEYYKVDLKEKATFDYYFNELKKWKKEQQQKSKNSDKGQNSGKGEGDSQGENNSPNNENLNNSNEENSKEGSQNKEVMGNEKNFELKPLDSHDFLHEGSEELDSQKRKVIVDKIEEVVDTLKEKGISKLPYLVEKIYNESFGKPQVNWRTLLRNYIGRRLRLERKSTRNRPNRRLGLKASGKKIGKGAKTVCAVDVSGSMSDRDYIKVVSEVKECLKDYPDKMEVMFFESSVISIQKFSKMNKLPKRPGSGGTNFDAVIKKANTMNIDLLIILTDGLDSVREIPKGYSVLWIFVGKYGNPSFPGKTIRIN